jgi:hypothetical protein
MKWDHLGEKYNTLDFCRTSFPKIACVLQIVFKSAFNAEIEPHITRSLDMGVFTVIGETIRYGP